VSDWPAGPLTPYHHAIVNRSTQHSRLRRRSSRRLGRRSSRLVFRGGLFAGLAAIVVTATGCNVQLAPYAAKVGNAIITPAQLYSAMGKASRDAPLKCLLQSVHQATRIRGAGTDTYDSGFAAFVLGDLIDAHIAQAAVRADGLHETAAARTLANSQVSVTFSSELTGSGTCASSGTGAELAAKLGPVLSQSFQGLDADEDVIAAKAAHIPLDAAGISAYEHADPAEFQESCLLAVATRTKALAKGAEALLRNGASFSQVVAQYDKSSSLVPPDGNVGCYTAPQLSASSVLGPLVAGTKLGHYSKVASVNGQFVILYVQSQPFEAEAIALQQLLQNEQKALTAVLVTATRRVKVDVDPAFGHWRPGTGVGQAALNGVVVPPSGPPAADLVNAGAARGTAVSQSSSGAPAIQGQGAG
jgi:hypothetical protein